MALYVVGWRTTIVAAALGRDRPGAIILLFFI
jgi:hypothetical protein